MSNIILEEVCPNFLPHVIIAAGAVAIAISVSINKAQWWDSNVGFDCNQWIFPFVTMLVTIFILTIVYMFIWYKSLCICRTAKVTLFFGIGFAFFFCSYIMLFLYDDKKAALWLAVATFLIFLFLTLYVFYYTTMWMGFVMLVLTLFVGHFAYQVSCVKI